MSMRARREFGVPLFFPTRTHTPVQQELTHTNTGAARAGRPAGGVRMRTYADVCSDATHAHTHTQVQQELDDQRAVYAEKLRAIRAAFFAKRDSLWTKRAALLAPMAGEGLPLFWVTVLRYASDPLFFKNKIKKSMWFGGRPKYALIYGVHRETA
jgi:hypothetical protein